jgi:hypothetical protein
MIGNLEDRLELTLGMLVILLRHGTCQQNIYSQCALL